MSDKVVESSEKIKWDKIIQSDRKKNSFDLKQIWDYRDLIFLFVKRDFIIYYKQTILGPLWYLLQPVFSTLTYMVIFGALANIGTDSIPQPLFYFSGTMLWTYFSGTLKEVSNVFFANKQMFGKVYFPRIVVPVSTMFSLLIKLIIQLALFAGIYVYYLIMGIDIGISCKIFLFPVLILWIGILGCGLGMIISSITTRYRDIALALDFLISLFMYATPVIYPLTQVPEKWRVFFSLNPVCAPMELFRYSFFGVSSIEPWAVIFSVMETVVFSLLGLHMFHKNEKTFVDVI